VTEPLYSSNRTPAKGNARRMGEVRQSRFEDFNLEHLSRTKPATTTRQRRVHRVPISDEAAAIVRQHHLVVIKGSRICSSGQSDAHQKE